MSTDGFQSIGTVVAKPSQTSSRDERRPTLCSAEAAEALALLVLGSYANTKVNDPETFVSAAAAVIGGFTEAIAREALNPRTGLQTRSKWLPHISEIREALEKVAGEHAARERRALLAKHRVLLDTPYGLRPENEARALAPPGAQRTLSRKERETLADDVLREFSAQGVPVTLAPEEATVVEIVTTQVDLDEALALLTETQIEALRKRCAASSPPTISQEALRRFVEPSAPSTATPVEEARR
jgi:hypothetical protein